MTAVTTLGLTAAVPTGVVLGGASTTAAVTDRGAVLGVGVLNAVVPESMADVDTVVGLEFRCVPVVLLVDAGIVPLVFDALGIVPGGLEPPPLLWLDPVGAPEPMYSADRAVPTEPVLLPGPVMPGVVGELPLAVGPLAVEPGVAEPLEPKDWLLPPAVEVPVCDVSAWAKPDPLASAAPTQRESAPAPSHVDAW
ncbi:hypothetical protein [Mycobacterium sp. OTB74]|uniref:hypothetical protein n=1 Tax=Mycobacterium sp. OTB74 TaxID=1853452 RepID=UPI002476D84E|nr:hypothetical protein [Mycobacterium sp. OTB74]